MSLPAPSSSSPPSTDPDPPPSKASLLKWWNVFKKTSPTPRRPSSSPSRPPKHGRPGGGGGEAPAPYRPPGRGLVVRAGEEEGEGKGVFGVELERSLKYASVAISMIGPDSLPYIYGYVPIVVAKTGMLLKETGLSLPLPLPLHRANSNDTVSLSQTVPNRTTATQTEGIFRVSGSTRRINDLQAIFDTPPRYGKDLDWSGFSVHDAASVLRRFLNLLPDPVIPQDVYRDFTAVLQKTQPLPDSIAQYRLLIGQLPAPSRWLLLYLLDFLSVFARSSDKNRMSASNLAVVFQPGLVSTRREGASYLDKGELSGFPGFGVGGERIQDSKGTAVGLGMGAGAGAGTESSIGDAARKGAGEHTRGKEVLEFLIEQQSHFVLGLDPPVLKASQGQFGRGRDLEEEEGGEREREKEKGRRDEQERDEESGYGREAGSGVPNSTNLSRRGSEKSVERRRLKKHQDIGGSLGKIKRSKTLPGSKGTTTTTPPTPTPTTPVTPTPVTPTTTLGFIATPATGTTNTDTSVGTGTGTESKSDGRTVPDQQPPTTSSD